MMNNSFVGRGFLVALKLLFHWQGMWLEAQNNNSHVQLYLSLIYNLLLDSLLLSMEMVVYERRDLKLFKFEIILISFKIFIIAVDINILC